MSYLLDAAGIAGAGCIVAGVVMAWGVPAGLIVGGGMLLVAAILGASRQSGGEE